MSWFWRTKPRSIIKTIKWFPHFSALQGLNWDETSSQISRFNKKPLYPTRRRYIYNAHKEEDTWLSELSFEDYMSGQLDQKETESNGRNDKSTFEFLGFGYVDEQGIIHTTDVGKLIVQSSFDQEDYLKQLLKLRLPNLIQKTKDKEHGIGVFPFQLVLTAFSNFESLNRSELALLFGCVSNEQIPTMLDAITCFKNRYAMLPKKNDTKKIKELFKEIFMAYYSSMPNQVNSYYDYSEALSRTLVYTGLFSLSGRSIASKLRVSEHAKMKVSMLQKNFHFNFPDHFSSIDDYMGWFGSTNNVQLPWENIKQRKEIIYHKIHLLEQLKKNNFIPLEDNNLDTVSILHSTQTSNNVSDLKHYEENLQLAITNHYEIHFIKVSSKTKEERDKILDKFEDILANDDMSALWLEVNTWKSLIAIPGPHFVKRNFKVEQDLSPRSFAPGVGNTPDMELYQSSYMIIPEVSLMTGVRQWEHEASSVVDHVLHFIKKHPTLQILGLFLTSRIHIRTLWQFFILNRESWVGTPVPIVPLTIPQYVEIITFIYKHNLEIDTLKTLLEYLSKLTFQYHSFEDWGNEMEHNIKLWKQSSLLT